MILRSIILLIILAALGYKLDHEQRKGRFQQADDLFLDFLLANVRDRFVVDAGKLSDQVVLVRLREEDRQEYGSWPPPPIDWQMILKGLVPFDPDVVVIATPLAWGQPPPEFVAEAGQALLPFTSVVLGVEAQVAKEDATADPATVALIKDTFPLISRIEGDSAQLPALSAITAMPDESIRRQMELGLTPASPSSDLPFALRCGDVVAPSLTLQALSRYTRTPYAQQRLRVGPGAGAHLGGGIYVPLSDQGLLNANSSASIASVNALNFMTGALADGLTAEDKTRLGKNKIIVIGIDNDAPQPTSARVQATALARTLALPRVHAIGIIARWIICGIAAVLGCFLLRFRGGKALRTGLLLIFAALVVSFLTFQSQLTWFPPTVPAALLAASTLFAMLFGHKPKR
jgi:CHASE2 domain